MKIEASKWGGCCSDRKKNIECDPKICGCKEDLCKNQEIRRKLDKKLNEDVECRYSWGVDLNTFRNFMEIIPMNLTENFKYEEFIEKKLIRSLTYQVKLLLF